MQDCAFGNVEKSS